MRIIDEVLRYDGLGIQRSDGKVENVDALRFDVQPHGGAYLIENKL